jgi:hypothetical protein
MRLAIVVCSICVGVLLAAGQIRPTGYTADHPLPALREGADGESVETQLQIREIRLEARLPSGRDETGTLQVLFDPERKWFQWRLGTVQLSPELRKMFQSGELPVPIEFTSGARVAYASKDALVTFTIVGITPTLYIQESRDHAGSLSDATTAALNAAAEKLGEYERQRPTYGTAVPLHPQIRNDFFCTAPCTKESSIMPFLGGAKIAGVSMRNGGQWEILVKGQWTEKIVLSPKFELVGMTRLD